MSIIDDFKMAMSAAKFRRMAELAIGLKMVSEVTGETCEIIIMKKDREKLEQFFNNIENKYKKDVEK